MTSILAKTRNNATESSNVGISLRQLLQDNLRAVRLEFGATARAHEQRRASEAVGADTMRDTGMSPEIASGIPAWQADLPFFMQSGFGSR